MAFSTFLHASIWFCYCSETPSFPQFNENESKVLICAFGIELYSYNRPFPDYKLDGEDSSVEFIIISLSALNVCRFFNLFFFQSHSCAHYIALFLQSSFQMINTTASIRSAVPAPSAAASYLGLLVVTGREPTLVQSHCQSQ